MSNGKHRIFAYGSLMRGYGNHRLLEESTFLGRAVTPSHYTMLNLGGFPGVVASGATPIQGELYEVDDVTLKHLDRLESHPNFYERTPIEVLRTGDGETDHEVINAEIYLLPQQWLDDNRIVESGDWTQARRRGRAV